MEANGKATAKVCTTPIPIHDHEADLDPDPESHPVKTINDLPPEVLDILFGCLTYTEKLISRLVCQKWNRQISSTLLKASYYSLDSKESLQVLLDSYDAGVVWKKLRILDLSDAGFILPTNLKNSITALDVRFPKFHAKICEYMRFLIGFPNLTTLKVSFDGGPGPGPNDKDFNGRKDKEYLSLKQQTAEIYGKLKVLQITLPFNSYLVLCSFLSPVKVCQSLSLDSLSITEEWPTVAQCFVDKNTHGRSFVCHPVFNTVRKSVTTLKSLTLDFSSKTMGRLLSNRILPFLTEMETLKLGTALIRRGATQRHLNVYFSALQKFIETQAGKGDLKNVILPWCPNAALCREFLESLPKDIEFVGNVQNEHLSIEFPTQFKNLNSLSIESDLTRDIFNDVHDNIRRLKFDLRKSKTFHPESPYGNMFDYLYNLTEIQLIGNDALSFDLDLQDIIFTLKDHLRVLHLESWKITDFGVLGIEEKDTDLQKLMKTKAIYVPQSSTENVLPKMKYPLGSMMMLEKLVLIGTNITDVGIILGFKFGKGLKDLTFSSDSGEITNFGIYSLGANNPGLEAFHGSFKSGKISTVGIEKLKTQLLLTESTRKFKVVNEKPDELGLVG